MAINSKREIATFATSVQKKKQKVKLDVRRGISIAYERRGSKTGESNKSGGKINKNIGKREITLEKNNNYSTSLRVIPTVTSY